MEIKLKYFVTFLKQNNAYENFMYYFKTAKYWVGVNLYIGRKYYTDTKEYFSTFNPKEWIVHAFSWRLTSEGYDYWHMISEYWKIFVSKNNI